MSVLIRGGNTPGYLAQVNEHGSLQVALTTEVDHAGYAVMAGEKGELNGAMINIPAEVSQDYAMRTAIETLQFNDIFLPSITTPFVHFGKWKHAVSTHTALIADGFLKLNAGASTAAGSAVMTSWATFPLYGQMLTSYFQFRARTSGAAQSNKVFELGVGLASGSSAPTDGCFFRWSNAGDFRCVVVNNSQETATDALDLPADEQSHTFLIEYTNSNVTFWIDSNLIAMIPAQPNQDSPVRTGAVPLVMREYVNTGTVIPCALWVSEVQVSNSGCAVFKDVNVMNAVMGQSMVQGQNTFLAASGGVGTLSNYTNNAAPTVITALSNTALPTGPANNNLPGGQWWMNALAGNDAVDNIIFGWQNPAISAPDIVGYKLFIQSVKISSVVLGAAVATTPTVFQWAIGVGSSAISLATADATAGVKAPRRTIVGMQSFLVGAAIGTQPPCVCFDFPTPLIVNPGEFVHLILKIVAGTATGSQTFRGTWQCVGFFE